MNSAKNVLDAYSQLLEEHKARDRRRELEEGISKFQSELNQLGDNGGYLNG